MRCSIIYIALSAVKMFFLVVYIVMLQFLCIYNEQSDCGCNILNRSKTGKEKYEIMLSVFQDNKQCPLRNDIITPEKKLAEEIILSDKIEEMVLIPDGMYQLGTDDVVIKSDNEGPKRLIKLKSFYIDKYEVTNLDFLNFTTLSHYKTDAEIFKNSFVFGLFLSETFRDEMKNYRVAQAPWWYKVNATWKFPLGGRDSLYVTEILDHPVVHVSWTDALAYCKAKGKTLPSEAQWEAACRGGHRDTLYPWGNKLFPNHTYMANIWQGSFPHYNSAKDGYVGTSPVTEFPPNDFGLYNMIGNVWEWTLDSWSKDKPDEKVKKGGSYLCHLSYCYRYRCSARSHNTYDSSAGNLGFRCARPA